MTDIITADQATTDEATTTFAELGVPAKLVAALKGMDRERPFPIQADTLPDTLAGRDVLGRGKTGSGKTVSYTHLRAPRDLSTSRMPSSA